MVPAVAQGILHGGGPSAGMSVGSLYLGTILNDLYSFIEDSLQMGFIIGASHMHQICQIIVWYTVSFTFYITEFRIWVEYISFSAAIS